MRSFFLSTSCASSALYDGRVRNSSSLRYLVAMQKKKNKEKLYFQKKILRRRLLYFKWERYEGEINRNGDIFCVSSRKCPFSNTDECTVFYDLQQCKYAREIHIDALLISRLFEFFANWSIHALHRWKRFSNQEMHDINKDSRKSALHNSLAMPTFLRIFVTHGLSRTKQNLI